MSVGANSTEGEPLDSWDRMDWPAPVPFNFWAALTSWVCPALVRAWNRPSMVVFCPKAAGAEANSKADKARKFIMKGRKGR